MQRLNPKSQSGQSGCKRPWRAFNFHQKNFRSHDSFERAVLLGLGLISSSCAKQHGRKNKAEKALGTWLNARAVDGTSLRYLAREAVAISTGTSGAARWQPADFGY